MTPPEDQSPLQGMARSIDTLFGDGAAASDESAGKPAPAEAAEPVPERSEEPDEGGIASADPLSDMEFLPLQGDEEVVALEDRETEEWFDEPEAGEPPMAEEAEPAAHEAAAPADAGPDAGLDPDDERAALAAAVEDYLRADAAHREEPARRIRELAGRLRDRGEGDALTDAVERLADAAGNGSALEASVALARLLTNPMVAARLAMRLGQARQEEERERRVAICSRLGRDMAVALRDALAETEDRSARRAYLDAMVRLDEDGMDVVAEMAEDARWFVVRNAVLVLGEAGGERAVQHLTMTLAHDDPRVRRETLLALAKIGGDDAVLLVPGKLADPDAGVREAAAMAVGALCIERAQRDLLARLEAEEDLDALAAVLRALGQIGDPGSVPAIEKKAVGSFFSRPPTEVRVAAYRALGAIGTPHAMSLIKEAAEDKDPAVRTTARGLVPAD